MAINYTTLLGLAQPVTGTEANTWGTVVNDEITALLDSAVAGAATLDVTAGNVTLTATAGVANQARMAILIATGTPGTTRNIVAPSQSKTYIVINQADASVVLKGSATTGVAIRAGQAATCVWNGADFEIVASGDVDGPASATDNAIARFDLTTGKLIQNSGVTIDDSNNVSGVVQLNATTVAATTGNITTVNATTVDTTNIEVTNLKAKDGTAAGSIADSTGIVTLTTLASTTGNITTVNATTVDTTNLEVTNLKAKDGTAAGSIADSTGVVTLASSVLTTTDINGGTIDGVTIGGASAGAGTFTSITDSGNLTFTGTGNRILGDTANATVANRLALQDSTTNAQTIFSVFPNGTSTSSQVQLYNSSSGTNYTRFNLLAFSSSVAFTQTIAGTGTYLPMTFFTSASEAMRITTDGIVLIGTATPLPAGFAKLEVNSDIYARPSTTAQSSQLKAAASDFFSTPSFTNTGVKQFGSTATGTTAGISNTTLGLLEFVNTSTALIYTNGGAPLVFGTNNTERMRIDSSGNVGIGLTNPSAALQLNRSGSTETAIKFTNGGGAASGFVVGASSAGAGLVYHIDNQPILFATNNTERMRIDSSGNVGIGTTAPTYPLHVNGTGLVASLLINGGGTYAAGAIYSDVSWGMLFRAKQASPSQADFMWANSADTERMRIDTSGNVGIGTSSPVSFANYTVLTVNGTNSDLELTRGGSRHFAIAASSTATDITNVANVPMIFGTNATERMRIDASGNVGIGTSSPGTRLDSTNAVVANGSARATIFSTDTSSFALGVGGGISFRAKYNTAGAYFEAGNVKGIKENATDGNFAGALVFSIHENLGSPTERMRIDSSGIVTMNAYGAGAATFSAAGVISSVSDETWKTKDGVPTNPDEMLQKLEPGYWFYNEEKAPVFGSERQLGFYAQNVNAAIGDEAAPIPEEGKPWGYYDRSVLAVTVMSLKNALKAIQEQQALIQDLTTRLTTLEGN